MIRVESDVSQIILDTSSPEYYTFFSLHYFLTFRYSFHEDIKFVIIFLRHSFFYALSSLSGLFLFSLFLPLLSLPLSPSRSLSLSLCRALSISKCSISQFLSHSHSLSPTFSFSFSSPIVVRSLFSLFFTHTTYTASSRFLFTCVFICSPSLPIFFVASLSTFLTLSNSFTLSHEKGNRFRCVHGDKKTE